MSLITQRARIRARRTGPTFGPLPISIVIAGRSAFATAAPALNRPFRRLTGRRNMIAAAAVPIVATAIVALNLLGPSAQPHYNTRVTVEPAAPPVGVPISGRIGNGAGLPSGLRLPSMNDQTTPRLAAVLAADIWQATSAVYQAQTDRQIAAASASVSPPAAAPTAAAQHSGPTLNDLIQAQIRVAIAQIVLQQVEQPQSDAAMQQARQAVADARAQVAATEAQLAAAQAQINATQTQIAQTQQLLDQNRAAQAAPPPTATATASPQSHAVDVANAQAALTRAQGALAQAQHPYSDDQIAGAQAALIAAKQELSTAQGRAQAAAARAPAARPAPAPATVAPVATAAPTVAPQPVATVQPEATSAADPLAGRTTLPDGTPIQVTAGAAAGGTGADGRAISQGQPIAVQPDPTAAAAVAPAAVDGPAASAKANAAQAAPAAAPAPVNVSQPAAGAATAPATVTPVQPSTTAVAGASTEPATAATAPSESAGTRGAAPAAIAALQQKVDQAQATYDLYTAPPDPAAVQKAQADLSAAQQALDTLTAQESAAANAGEAAATNAAPAAQTNAAPTTAAAAPPAATATPAPTAAAGTQTDPSSTAATAVGAPESLAAVQQRYDQAKQWLAALTSGPDPDTIRAAQAELQAAQHDYNALLAQADSSITAQLDSDPQSTLAKYGGSSELLASRPDARAFAWPAHGPITSFFGPGHPLGIDIGQGLGGPVTAAASGVVSFSGGDPCCSYGYYIDIIHPGGYMTRYGHLLVPSFLKPGDHVTQGQILGVSGSTGFSTGPHVHFEIRLNGVPLDPLRLIMGAVDVPRLPQ